MTLGPAYRLDPNPERDALLSACREFVDSEVVQEASALDEADAYPERISNRMRELGYFGLTIGAEWGGLGLDYETYALLVEELSRGWISVVGLINSHNTVAYAVEHDGSEEQKRRFLPRMATGEWRGAIALSEPDTGSDLASVRTVAVRTGEGYRLTGEKRFITNARAAHVLLVLARTASAEAGHNALSAFLVEKGTAGLEVRADHRKLGFRGLETADVTLDDVVVPTAARLGPEGGGFAVVMSALEVGRLAIAASAVGLARAALEHALRYSRERRTFGKPIGEHQAVALRLADMATRLNAARLLTLAACRAKRAGGRADMDTSMAKLYASETAMDICLAALRIHGGYGYVKEYPIERYFRDAPMFLVGEGTNEILSLLIARRLLQRAQAARP